jgi:two-component system, OmpR family, phosphate regulon sensor histidine kinase PhoR
MAALAWAAAIAVAAAVSGAAAGAAAGWACAALGFAGLLAYYVWHLARLARWLRDTSANPVPEATGSWDVVLATLHRHERDHARREAALAEALGRFRRAAQALPEGVVILDGKNRIEWCNDKAAAMLNLDAAKDLRRPVADLVRAPDFVRYLASEAAEELVLSSKAGSVLALKLIPYDETQKLLLCRDVTQSERVEIMRRDFVANVSHELRTPLTVLVGFLETVRELKLDPQRVRDYVGMMREQAARMQRIIEDLLALSVLESAPPPPEERVDVERLLMRVRVDGEALSGGRHSFETDCAPGADLVGSEQELTSALGNLVSNAVRYTPKGGRIRLVWRDGADGASFSVEDTGPGIAPEHIPRLTERFYRVDRSRSRESGGTGLGLAIVKHALARHQAQLEIDSKPGAGSRFTARFPAKRLLFNDPAGSEPTPQQR